MPPSTRRTTKLRIGLALLFAFALPSLALGQVFYWSSPSSEPRTLEIATIYSGSFLIFGAFLGWPYVLGAAACWAALDHVGRHHPWAAAIVGLATGAAVSLTGPKAENRVDLWLAMTLGLVTALGVWWIAYGRQDRLPAPHSLPKPRLAF